MSVPTFSQQPCHFLDSIATPGGASDRRCDWRIVDLIAGDRPATLYLVVATVRHQPDQLVRLLLNQIGRRLTEDLHATNRRHRVLLMLDEFPA